MKRISALTFGLLTAALAIVLPLTAPADVGTGADGPLAVAAEATMTINTVASAVTGNSIAGATTIDVADASGFAPGNEVLIITMVDPETDLELNLSGVHEFAVIDSITDDTITFDAPLANGYDGTGSIKHQVIHVPQYTTVTVDGTLTSPAWDGTTGGILVFRANATVAINAAGVLDMDGRGYRFGAGNPVGFGDFAYGQSGEGVIGQTGTHAPNSNPLANGAGAGRGADGSGGGGGHATAGNTGAKILSSSIGGIGGLEVGDAEITKLLMGGGGSASGAHSSGVRYGADGGSGGGIIKLFAATLNMNGAVSADGVQGQDNTWNSHSGQNGGGGGAGAGGSIVLSAVDLQLTGDVAANGGIGGDGFGASGQNGGDGADGRVRLNYTTRSGAGEPTQTPFEGLFNNIEVEQLNDVNDTVGPYTVTASVFDDEGDPITAVTLFYRVDGGGFSQLAMLPDGDVYTADIPGQAGGALIEYYGTATDGTDNYTDPNGAPTDLRSFTIVGLPVEDLAAVTDTDGSIDVSWNPPVDTTDFVDYSVYRSTVADFTPGPGNLLVAGISDLTYADDDAGLLDFVTYYYKVAANYLIGGNAASSFAQVSVVTNDTAITTLRGIVLLEGLSDHSGITVTFHPESPSAEMATATTDINGVYELEINNGVYTVTYTADTFQAFDRLTSESIIDDRDLGTSQLFWLGNTNIEGDQSGVWDGLYTVTGNVTVPAGETLTIMPGSEVRFLGNYHFDVFGKLIADASAARAEGPILFTSAPANQIKAAGQWQGIDFEDSSDDTSVMNNVIVEYAVDGIYWVNANASLTDSIVRYCSQYGLYMNAAEADPVITDVEVHNCSSHGIYIFDADPTFTRMNSHHNTGIGIYWSDYANGSCTDSQFNNNTSHGMRTWEYCNPRMTNCEFNDNDSWGVRIDFGSSPRFEDCTMRGNITYGVAVSPDHNTWCEPRFINCVVEENTATGIYFARHTRLDSEIRGCTIQNNGSGGIYLWYYCSAHILNNRILNNNGHGITFANHNHNRIVRIYNNVIAYNAADGIFKNTSVTSNPEIINNTIYQNGDDGIDIANAVGTDTIVGNLIINNADYGLVSNSPIEDFRYNNIFGNSTDAISNTGNLPVDAWTFVTTNANGHDSDIYANIAEAPGLALTDAEDFSLLDDSSAIDAGDPAGNDPDGTVEDQGALFRDQGNPHTVTADSFADGSVTISWDAVDNTVNGALNDYNVYFREAGGGAYSLFETTAVLTSTVTGLTNNTLYDFTVTGNYPGPYESTFAPAVQERPGVSDVSFTPEAFNVTVDQATVDVDLTIDNPGTRQTELDWHIGSESGSTNFDGSNDRMTLSAGSHLTGMSNLTVECWLRREGNGHFEFISKNYREYSLYIGSTNRFGMYKGVRVDPNAMYNNEFQNWTSSYTMPANEWHHLAVVWEGEAETVKFFVDGALIEEFDEVVNIPIPTGYGYNLEFGRRASEGHYFNGQLADVRIWNVARTAAQIQRYKDTALSGDETGLVGYWPLRTDFNDRSPFGVNGTAHSGAGLTSSFSPPTLPLLPFTMSEEQQTIEPGTPTDVTFTFSDTGDTGTFSHTTPVDSNTALGQIDFEMALTYGDDTPATPVHFVPVAATTLPYTVIVTGAVLDGVEIAVGDEIGIFDGATCVGAGIFDGDYNLVITAWESDGGAGFTDGNPMTFVVYDASTDLEATTTITYEVGDGTFGYGEFTTVSIEATVFTTQVVNLTGGMVNLISFNRLPQFSSANTIFGGLPSMEITYDDRGHSLIPEYGIDTIGDIDFKRGYHVYVNNAETINYTGTVVDPAQWEITLLPNQWNSIAFLGTDLQDITAAFPTAVTDVLAMIKTSSGDVYIPSVTNEIVNLQPGVGYQVAINGNDPVDFSYQITGPAGGSRSGSSTPVHFSPVSATGLSYSVVLSAIRHGGEDVAAGTEVGIFDGDLCVGAGVYEGGEFMHVVVWEAVPAYGLPGYSSGNDISFKLAVDGDIFASSANFIKGDGTFGSDTYAIASIGNAAGMAVELVEIVDPSQTVDGVTNQRLVFLSITGDGEGLEYLVTESADSPDADAAWLTERPSSYEIQGDEGVVELYVWVRNGDGEVSLLHSGSHQQIVLDLGTTFRISADNANVAELKFGQWTYATDGIDDNLDTETSAARGLFDDLVVMYLTNVLGGNALVDDFRPVTDLSRWRLHVELPDGVSETTLSFDIPSVPLAKRVFLQQLDGETPVGAPVDLSALDQLVVDVDSVFEIAYAETQSSDLPLDAGWNLVSIPTMTLESAAELLAAIKDGTIWQWDGERFNAVDDAATLNPEAGYWVKSIAGGNTGSFDGIASDGRLALKRGWNVIGVPESVALPASAEIAGPVWWWDADSQAYQELAPGDLLEPYRGYWVFATANTVLDLGTD